ncbi:hypothetical protein CHUAL_001810 [Chamberlinius hualienensis]
MGNPSATFSNFENQTQVYQWRDMIKDLAKHYIVIFGLSYVQQWNFESWNEPDHGDFDNLNFTLQGFLNYYDACSEGLRMAHPTLRLGGPAESFRGKFTYFSYHLLAHCSSGTNYFTGEKGIRLDFISMHKKGNVTSISILEEELDTINEIHATYPNLKYTPIYNDEGDPLVGWWKSEEWRADVTYAAMVAKVISQHIDFMLMKTNNSINYALLSNDNGFINTLPVVFHQRTLLSRFQNFQNMTMISNMIRKPVFILTGLLNFLGDNYGKVQIGHNHGTNAVSNSHIGAVAAYRKISSNNFDYGVLIYNSGDTNSSNNPSNLTIRIEMPNMKLKRKSQMLWVLYQLDNNLTNPYQIWKHMGQPLQPNATQIQILRKHEGPHRLCQPHKVEPISGKYVFHHSLMQPGVLVLHACHKPSNSPGKVTNIQIHSALNDDCIVTWNTPKIKTKQVKI